MDFSNILRSLLKRAVFFPRRFQEEGPFTRGRGDLKTTQIQLEVTSMRKDRGWPNRRGTRRRRLVRLSRMEEDQEKKQRKYLQPVRGFSFSYQEEERRERERERERERGRTWLPILILILILMNR